MARAAISSSSVIRKPPSPKQLDYHTIREIFTRFREADPEPIGELDHVNAYTLVVAVALSAQATDAGVNKATAKLFKIADTPQKMLDLGEEAVIEHIKTIGLYRNKAKNVMKLSRILVDEYDHPAKCDGSACDRAGPRPQRGRSRRAPLS